MSGATQPSVDCERHVPHRLQRRTHLDFDVVAQAVQAYLYTLERIEKYLHHTTNTRLALDVLALRMPRA